MACKRFTINSCSVRSCCFSISDVVVVVVSKDAAGDNGWFVAGVTDSVSKALMLGVASLYAHKESVSQRSLKDKDQ